MINTVSRFKPLQRGAMARILSLVEESLPPEFSWSRTEACTASLSKEGSNAVSTSFTAEVSNGTRRCTLTITYGHLFKDTENEPDVTFFQHGNITISDLNGKNAQQSPVSKEQTLPLNKFEQAFQFGNLASQIDFLKPHRILKGGIGRTFQKNKVIGITITGPSCYLPPEKKTSLGTRFSRWNRERKLYR
jgi:hypothetical protein